MSLRVLGLVPARGGSKGVPRKNERTLAGQTLLERTRDAAVASGVIDRVVLSTDSESIAALGESLGLDVPFRRPAELATDEAPMLGVVEHALRALAESGYRPDAVALLQPTSPLRRPEHIAAAVQLLTADATSQSTVFYTPFNDTIQRQLPYGLLGARGEFGPSNRRWAVNVYTRNITNTDYITGAFGASPVAFGGRPGPSRETGIQLIIGR